ncbi:HesB/IscA family protein [Bacillus sp. 1P06AnD]|uniref:HesB/IscA family protein n=1 Tax=Bacillus sp. 1P06AnD TaxID=3132208 RepID=UPI00399FCEB1
MEQIITITESAALQIKEMMKNNEEEGSLLRVAVHGGGCSGLSYGLGFALEVNDDDIKLQEQGIDIVVDQESSLILKGTVIDYKQSMMGGGFIINNPNAIASCGCGSSFRTATNAGRPEEC